MKKSMIFIAMVMLVTSWAGDLLASNRRIQLDFGDQHLQGQNTLFLKQVAKQQYPHLNLRNSDLIRVRLVAKTKAGRGTAVLDIGGQQSNAYTVDGNPYDFFNPDITTFDKVVMANPNWDSLGKWQIQLQGNFIIRKVVLVIDQGFTPPPPPVPVFHWEHITTINPAFGVYQTTSLNINKDVKSIKFINTRGRSKVTDVEVVYGNGSSQRLSSLEISMKNHQEVEQFLGGGNYVSQIIIRYSSRVFFKPGSFEVQILAR